MSQLKFPDKFFWGAATSAHQVEGGTHNSWSEWERANATRLATEAATYYQTWQKKKSPEMLTPENYVSGSAANFWNRYEEDFDILEQLHLNSFRLSIEWSRIEPEEGQFDEAAIEHYRQILASLKRRGITTFVTCWHWTDPLWIAERGGWEHRETPDRFARYVRRIAEEFKDFTDFWQPLNEPGTFVGMGYVQGVFPPQVRSFFRANRTFKNLMRAHRIGYRTIKEISPNAQVGMSHYAVFNIPYQNKFINRLVIPIIDYFRNWRFLNSIDDVNDFIGIQFYHTDHLDFNPLKWRFGLGHWGPITLKNPNTDVTDMGWDIYPEGIYHLLKRAAKYGKPIYITENGLADADDSKRERFIRDHLAWTHKAISEGIDVRGYFYWSLLDNFEWDKGFWPRFGLVHVDYATQTRTIRPSALKYGAVAEANALEV
jgi:beta-glucosidase